MWQSQKSGSSAQLEFSFFQYKFCPKRLPSVCPLLETSPISEASVSHWQPGKTHWWVHHLHKGVIMHRGVVRQKQTDKSDRQCSSLHTALGVTTLCKPDTIALHYFRVFWTNSFSILWMPFHWAISDSRSSIGNQYCRNSAIISEYQDNKNLKNLSIAHMDAFSLPETLLKPKASLKAQLLFLMHSCSGWHSLFLPCCWRGGCSTLTVMHCQYFTDQWWREAKLSLSLCWFSRTTLNSQHNCLRDSMYLYRIVME